MKIRRVKPSGRVPVRGQWTMHKLQERALVIQLVMADDNTKDDDAKNATITRSSS